jgi:hypothetical protein
MVLTTVGLSVWMTLRAVRKQTLSAFSAAALCWTIAAFTKQTVIPVMVMGLGYALYAQRNKLRALGLATAMFVAFAIPAGWQSMMILRFFAPFGYEEMQTLSRKCDSITFGFHVSYNYNYVDYIFAPEAFYFNTFYPFGTYTTKRSNVPYVVNLDLTKGHQDWDQAIRQLEWSHTWSEVLEEYKENLIFLFFTYSYPDSTGPLPHSDPFLPDAFWLRKLNFHLRWTWAPCLLLVLLYGPFARMKPGKIWILLVAFVMTWGFLLQDIGIVEGRYRKLIEPFLLLSVFFLLESRFSRGNEERVSLYGFVMNTYIAPLTKQLLAPVFPSREASQPETANALPHVQEPSGS